MLVIVHHIVAIVLILTSWWFAYIRLGSVVFLLHDCSDIFLEAARLSHMMGLKSIKNTNFVLFAVCFCITRVILFPARILYSISGEAWYVEPPLNRNHYRPFVALLLSLYLLDVYWFFLICRAVKKFVFAKGDVESDVRSDDEDDDGSSKSSKKNKKKK